VTALLARRRHPLATAALLFVALVAVGGLYAAVAGRAQASPQTAASSTQIDLGRKLYSEGCSSCHGLNAEGGQQPDGSISGPSLIGVGAASVDFQVGTGRMPLQTNGPQAKNSMPSYTPAEIAALAAYIASLGPGPSIPDDATIDPNDADVALGGQLFRSNCAACHNFAGSGGALTFGKRAPAIVNSTPRHMYEAMITGPANMPVFPDSTLRPADKRAIIAYVETLHNAPNPGGLDLGRVGPVTEGLLFWIVGIGALVVAAVWIGAKAR
jgi:ubiquinol-cytochrome c reductase cytochrome c subunit